jgi:hypothetical protein
MNELKAVIKANAQAAQSGSVNKISVESTVHDDDFQEIEIGNRHVIRWPINRLNHFQNPLLKICFRKQC